MKTKTDEVVKQAYRAEAIRLHHREGEIEIDSNASVLMTKDHPEGAYVEAWIWIWREDIQVKQ